MVVTVLLSVSKDEASALAAELKDRGNTDLADELTAALREDETCGCMGCAIRIDALVQQAREWVNAS